MNWGIVKTIRPIRPNHCQLCSLPAYDVQDSFATLYVGHHCSHTHLHGHLHCDKLQMEISTHVASSGMMVGGLLSYSLIFNFNPVSWLCFSFAIRNAGDSTHHRKATHIIRSSGRIYCRIVLRCHRNFVYLKKILVLTL